MKVRSIEFVGIECEVYDITVDVDHSYVVEGVVLHNCVRCATAMANGPYVRGTQPSLPVHVNCRCVSLPHTPGVTNTQPFVRDFRSVKNIPKSERSGKIGQTRMPIEQFFDRMSQKDRIQYMGPTRARLWKKGKIDSVKDLVDQRTLRPLRLDELPQ